jgi:two-component system, response regulator PdtaR
LPNRDAVILVVEDEDLVREFVEQVLSDAGYEVLLAANADEAVRVLAQREVTLLFTDIVMPGSIDGLGLARLVYAKHPRTRVLCASGYAPVLESLPAGDPAFAHLLRKPYRSDTLLDEVAGLLC